MPIEEIAIAIVDALSAEAIPYMLVGSFSSNYYGVPRSTHDADFVIHLENKSISCLRAHLRSQFSIEPQMAFEAVTGTTKHVVNIADSAFEVELFNLSDDPHDQERFLRRKNVNLLGRDVYLPTPEDVVITKLRWLRRKDFDDIQGVLSVQHTRLDWPYIFKWCAAHGTRKQLDVILESLPED